jgi:hypothetical protein
MPNFKNNKGFKMKGFQMHGKASRKSPFYVEEPIALEERRVQAIPTTEPEVNLEAPRPVEAPLSEKEQRRADRQYEREGRKRNRQMKREAREIKRAERDQRKIGDRTVGDLRRGAFDQAAELFVNPENTDLGIGVSGVSDAVSNIKRGKFGQGVRGLVGTYMNLRDRRNQRRSNQEGEV